MKKGLFAGTFDPVSLGHLDLIKRAAKLCDVLIIGVADNAEKNEKAFSLEERVEMLKKVTKGFKGIEIVTFSGLVADYARQHNIDFLIRGLRAHTDHGEEFQMALTNRKIGNIETVFLLSGKDLSHISSSRIRELGKFGRRLHHFVSDELEEFVFQRLYSG